MHNLVSKSSLKKKSSTEIILLTSESLDSFIKDSANSKAMSKYIALHDFTAKPHSFLSIINPKGELEAILSGIDNSGADIWALSHLPKKLPSGNYELNFQYIDKPDGNIIADMATGWALACYEFDRFKNSEKKSLPVLALDSKVLNKALIASEAHFLVRDLINTPANMMQPYHLCEAAKDLASKHNAKINIIVGDDLIAENYPAIHTVGRASECPPALIDIRKKKTKCPKLTLVGKGVCFDTGGLDIKPSSGMFLMKKDMGGAAHVMGLGDMIMSHDLPVDLRILIPAVENSISANSYRPSDVISTRKGLSVEIGNTDAEGRLILADALTEANNDKPDLLMDFATLTGAARVALGTEVPAFFTNDDVFAETINKNAMELSDYMWRLPLHSAYQDMLNSDIADTSSTGNSSFGGAITAALFLKRFVEENTSWMHVDLMAWNQRERPGRPKGGEAMALRTTFQAIRDFLEV